MAVLIDPPAWPAHGTLWCHLVSDSNLPELHEFAARLGVPRRAFDLDHYDVPAARYERALALGAIAVTSKQLLHALRTAGLRVRQVERPAATVRARERYLHEQWVHLGRALQQLTPYHGSAAAEVFSSSQRITAGTRLLDRWQEPHRSYHNANHLEDVLLAFNQFEVRGKPVSAVTLAAGWFHDAVYTGQAHQDEHESARLAHRILGSFGVDLSTRDRVAASILATVPLDADPTAHTHPKSDEAARACADQDAAQLLDADLAIFAAPETRYLEYAAGVRAEYAHVDDHTFAAARGDILERYLRQERVFRTDAARSMWEARARSNVSAELARLRALLG